MARSRLHELSESGVSVWVDSLSREMLETGHLARLMEEDAVVGVTSNPTIFEKALSTGDWYDEQLREELERSDDTKEVFFALAVEDIKRACDLLLPVWERTDGVDGFVSIEVDPDLAYERQDTFEQAKLLHELVDRKNVYVKIPATEPGIGAIEDSIAAGRSINVTLIFSLDRYSAVAEAYVRGLERLVEGGGDPTHVASVASFFVSRVDTECDRRLAEIGRDDIQGRLAVDNAKLAYERYAQIFSGPRWEALAAAGARPQRCLWASTSTKNPAYRDVLYVEELIGPDTVNTMPFETITAFQDHGVVRPGTLTEGHRGGASAPARPRRCGRRLRRRHGHARARGCPEVLGLVRVAARGHRRQARRPRLAGGPYPATARRSSSCSRPFDVTALPESMRDSPAASEKRPPASSTITCTAARSHSFNPSASTAPSTAPSATSMCAQKSPSPRACQALRASGGTVLSIENESTASSTRPTAETCAGAPFANAPAPRSAHQRPRSAGADTTPTWTTPPDSSAISVAHTGMPRA